MDLHLATVAREVENPCNVASQMFSSPLLTYNIFLVSRNWEDENDENLPKLDTELPPIVAVNMCFHSVIYKTHVFLTCSLNQ
jgi:hypothetical protein